MTDPIKALGLRGDPTYDYGGPRPPRAGDERFSVPVTILTAAAALIVGFLVTAGISAGRNAAEQQGARKAELIELVHDRQERTEELAAELDALRAEVEAQQVQAARGVPALEEQLAEVGAAAGMTRLHGPGVRVTVSDATQPCATGRQEDCRIQDVDLQQIVNALFAAGAEGVAINGERIIAVTAIRNAGGSILVNYRVLTSPYVVEAVGHPQRLLDGFSGSSIARDFKVWQTAYRLGFTAATSDEVELPSYSGSIRLRAGGALP